MSIGNRLVVLIFMVPLYSSIIIEVKVDGIGNGKLIGLYFHRQLYVDLYRKEGSSCVKILLYQHLHQDWPMHQNHKLPAQPCFKQFPTLEFRRQSERRYFSCPNFIDGWVIEINAFVNVFTLYIKQFIAQCFTVNWLTFERTGKAKCIIYV